MNTTYAEYTAPSGALPEYEPAPATDTDADFEAAFAEELAAEEAATATAPTGAPTGDADGESDADGEAEHHDEDKTPDPAPTPPVLPVPVQAVAPALPEPPARKAFSTESGGFAIEFPADSVGDLSLLEVMDFIRGKTGMSVIGLDGRYVGDFSHAPGMVLRGSAPKAPRATTGGTTRAPAAPKEAATEAESTIAMRALLVRGRASQDELTAAANFASGAKPSLTHFRRILPAGTVLDIATEYEMVHEAGKKPRIVEKHFYSAVPATAPALPSPATA